MSITHGTVGLLRYETLGERISDEALWDLVQANLFKELIPGTSDAESFGFINWLNITEAPFYAKTFLADDWVIFGVRLDRKTVPSSLLKLKVQLAMRDNPKQNRKEVQAEVNAELLKTAQISPNLITLCWDRRQKMLYSEGGGRMAKWLLRLLDPLGVKAIVAPGLTTDHLYQIQKKNAMDIPDIDATLTLVPNLFSFVPTGAIKIKLSDQTVSVSGDGTEVDSELNELLVGGATIKQLRVLTALDSQNFELNLDTGNRIRINLGKAQADTAVERALIRLERLQAIEFMLRLTKTTLTAMATEEVE